LRGIGKQSSLLGCSSKFRIVFINMVEFADIIVFDHVLGYSNFVLGFGSSEFVLVSKVLSLDELYHPTSTCFESIILAHTPCDLLHSFVLNSLTYPKRSF